MAGNIAVSDAYPTDSGGRFGAPVLYDPSLTQWILRRAFNTTAGAAAQPGYADAVAWSPKGTPHYTQVNVGTAATLLLAARSLRMHASIYNNSGVTIYLGSDASVTTANGFPVPPGQSYEDDNSSAAWYAIAPSGSANDARLLETY